jgi:hypothetical protein
MDPAVLTLRPDPDYTLWTCDGITLGFHAANSSGRRFALEWWVFFGSNYVRWTLIDDIHF